MQSRRQLGGLLARAAASAAAAAAASCSPSSSMAAAAAAAAASSSCRSFGFAASAAEAAAAARARLLSLPGPCRDPLSSPFSRSSSFFSTSSPASSALSRAARKRAAAAAASAPAQQEVKATTPTTPTPTTPTAAAANQSSNPSPPASQRVANSRYTMTPAAGPGGSMGMSLRASPVASGVLAEPFRGDPPPLPLSSWLTPSGWRARWKRWVSGAKSMYSLAKCKKLVPGWTLPAFKREALTIYEATCRALAAGDRGQLRSLLTPAEYAAAKRQIKAREEAGGERGGGWAQIEWSLADPRPDPGRDVEVVHARLVMANPKDERAGFAQVTVRVRARHSFVARDARGRVVAVGGGGGSGRRGSNGGGGGGGVGGGERPSSSSLSSSSLSPDGDESDDRTVDVVDTWVLERFLGGGPSARWRLAGRLSADVGGGAQERRRGGFWASLAARKAATAEEK